jgi:predicted Rossmann fold nucleotide-binding protein DprA/Smf involved in DNA uptake
MRLACAGCGRDHRRMSLDARMLCPLARAAHLDAPRLRESVATLGSLEALFVESPSALRALGLPASVIEALRAPDVDALEADLTAIERHGLVLLPATDPAYPPRLAALAGAPAVLWVRGCVETLSLPQLALVGSRHPTAGGRRTAREFAYHFASAGLAITSGLALGIDAAGHDGALLAGGRTVAVLGTGLLLVIQAIVSLAIWNWFRKNGGGNVLTTVIAPLPSTSSVLSGPMKAAVSSSRPMPTANGV